MTRIGQFYQDKVAVITGAASGMGRSYVIQLAKMGCKVACCDVDISGLQETAELAGSDNVLTCSIDVSDKKQMDGFAEQVKQTFGDAHIIINNAGIEGSNRPVWSSTRQELERVMGVNFYGVVNGTKSFMAQLMAQDWSAIVNVSSVFGLIGTPHNSDYCASKFAVRGYTESLMSEMSLLSPHVQVHLVHPGGVNTNITRKPTSQAFAKRFLTTPPDEIVTYVLAQVIKNNPRIVYGNQARTAYWASRLLSFNTIKNTLASQIKRYRLEEDYRNPKPEIKD